MCLVDLEKVLNCVPQCVLCGIFKETGVQSRPFGSSIFRVGVWFILPAVSQTCSQVMLETSRAAFCHWFCSLLRWTLLLGAARDWRGSGLRTTW